MARVLLAATPWLSGGGCSRSTETGATPADRAPVKARHILLFSLDTLRADHLGCYGYPRNTSLCLDEFARAATRYARARSTAPWTTPSHASLFTGLFPFEHGARTYRREEILEAGLVHNVRPLAEEHLTLAEVLQGHGYRTAAFVANTAYLDPRFQLDQGFDRYVCRKGKAPEVAERVIRWIDKDPVTPFFLFVNTMDTHKPYNNRPREGFLDREIPDTSKENLDELYRIVLGENAEPPPELVREIIDQYDLGIANLDEGVGKILGHLEKVGLLDQALVLVTSDHGEYFGEHQLVEHSKDVYEEALWIPLLVKAPGQIEGVVDERPISLAHVPALILRHASGVPPAEELGPLAAWDRDVVMAENYYARLKDVNAAWGPRFDRIRTALYEWPFKFIHSSDGQHELYHLESDPKEQVNLLEKSPDLASALAGRLAALKESGFRDVEAAGAVLLTEEDLEVLEALGYH